MAKDIGGVVASATGETVMIGAGALPADTAVSITRIELADMASLPGLAIPGAGVLQLAGAFKLDLGRTASSFPVQLAVPLQAGITAEAGTEVLFFRKGQVITADGSFKPTWWLVDNGFVGADGVARTASPPYGGVDTSGEYMVCRRLPGVIGGVFNLGIGGGGWADFGNFCLGGGLSGVNIQSEVIGILASQSSAISGGSYKFGVPQFSQNIVIPTIAVGDTFTLNLQDFMPPVASPYGNVVLPNVSDASVNDAGEMHISIDNPNPGQFTGSIVLRMRLPDGSTQDVQTFAGDKTGDVIITPPPGIAVGSVGWQLVRLVPQEVFTGSGELSGEPPAEFAGNTLRISPKPLMVQVLNRTGVAFFRENKPVGSTTLVGTLGQPNNFDEQTITGTKVQPVTYSDDLTRVYVAGNGVIYVIDTLTYKLLDPIYTYGGNIVSLASTGGLLFIGEGNSYGSGASNARLMVMSTIPGSKSYNKPITLKGTGIEATPLGIAGMAVGPDGKNLVVAVPKQRNSVTLGDPNKRGDVLVFNIDSLDLKTGKIDAPVKAQLPADSSGKAPQTITATEDPSHFLVADVADYNKGLATLVLTRDKDGSTSAAKMTAIPLSQPGGAVRLDRLDIQRAQSAVLVTYQGEEYAIVADDNYNFLDPYWRAMFEAPMFSQLSPSGPPTAIGGSASAKKVNVGGKLGIVKDPFGANPQFMGATLPLDGYGIVNLSLSPDNSVLIGQLKGSYGTDDPFHQKDNQNHAWSVGLLLQAAIDLPEQDRMSKHIALPASAELLLPSSNANAGGYLGAPVGTFFDDEPKISSIQGNMGDIIEVDLREQAARAMLGYSATTAFAKLTKQQQENVIITKAGLSEFTISKATQDSLSLDNGLADNNALKLVMGKAANGGSEIYSRTQPGGLAKGDFKDSGILYLRPNLTQPDEDKLRQGMHLDADKSVTFSYEFKETSDDKVSFEWKKGLITVTAKDFINSGARVFFGDRPLENPGYSAFTLSGEVSLAAANAKTIDSLDVYRVEQRLRYLGYGLAPAAITGAGEVTVDGNFSKEEAADLQLFEKIIRYGTGAATGKGDGTGSASDTDKASLATASGKASVQYTGATDIYTILSGGATTSSLTAAGKKLSTAEQAQALAQAEAAATIKAINSAKIKAKAGYDKQVEETKQFAPAKFGADGLIEAGNVGDAKLTKDWLNAYNAPHWMQYAGELSKKLTGWTDKTGGGVKSMGTSWVYDLMSAAQKTNGAQERGKTVDTRLWFNGAGSLGGVLNLGVNNKFVSKGNQDQVNGKDVVLGVLPQSANGATPVWNFAKAQALAARLHNPNLNNYVLALNGFGTTSTNVPYQENQQDQALLDFYSVYLASLKGGVGSTAWSNEQLGLISAAPGADRITIQEALFGDGSATGGVVNNQNILIGGAAAPLGAAMTAESLRSFMADSPDSQVNFGEWVEPLQKAMIEFDIKTPQRIVAFLAQVKAEGNLLPKPESFIYATNTASRLASIFKSAFSYQFNYDNHTSAAYRNKLAHDRYNDDSRTREQNAQLFYDEILSPALTTAGGTWADSVQALIANRVYSSDYGTGMDRDPQAGDQASGDGWTYRGHGQLQLTGKSVITQFADYVRDNYAKAGQTQQEAAALRLRIINTPDILDTDKALAARSAGWEWGVKKNVNPSADQLNEALVPWSPNNIFTTTVTKRIATATESFESRYENWQRNVRFAYKVGNPYEDMQAVLAGLGIRSATLKGYESQFGISLRTPKLAEISSAKQLLTPSTVDSAITPSVANQSPNALLQDLLTTAKQTLNLNEGEFTMLITDQLDLPDFPPAVAIIAKADGSESSSGKAVRSVGVCGILQLTRRDAYSVDAEITARSIDKTTGKLFIDPYNALIKVVQQPKHGKLWAPDGEIWTSSKIISQVGSGGYVPDADFTGKDSFIMQVEGGGHKVNVYYFIAVTSDDGYIPGEHCKILGSYKISQSNFNPGSQDYAAWQRASQLSTLLATASQSLVGFQDLAGFAVGQTTGQGANAQITLDPTAAGHNWFIDPTPLDNQDDFLPTSNPNIWQAKANTDAAGKMDLLSVLLHEYGHALDLEHSADADDFMATTLQPGERRLPSSQELNLMAQLVAQLKTPDTGNNPQTPKDPSVPKSPFGPLGAGLGFMAVGRLRRSSADSARAGSTTAADFAQYDTVANPSLVNGQFNSQFNAASTGWSTQGKVTIGSLSLGAAAAAATLAESNTSQTRLNQVFMVGPQDRFLSFTLSNLALDDATTGPDDAFEVGLLNANTGAALSGSIGLSNSDALLNLQPGSTGLEELAAQGVTHVSHADGSRTYLVDLSGIARDANGKVAVNLSFDLIGFGATAASMGSQVQVSDVRLLGLPQTRDDSASGAEDSTPSIAVLSNDIDAAQPGFAPLVVAGPVHGTLNLNADGSFAYTPQANYFGVDSFTYQVTNARDSSSVSSAVRSNISTVNLVISPVNDAPVAADLSLRTAEDTPVVIELLATDIDSDASSVAYRIQTQPQHGTLTLNPDGSYSYLANTDFNGSDSFTYQVGDGELDSNLATVFITVTPVNDAPSLGEQTLATLEDNVLTGTLLASAADADSTVLTAAIVAGPQHGTLTVNADGSFSFAADANYFGTDSFTYKVNDGELDSGLATVSLTITAVNDVPVATDATATINEDTALTIDLRNLGVDVEDAALSPVIVSAPIHGLLTLNPDGRYTYAPDADFNGLDNIRFALRDSEGALSNEATLNITVTAVNDAPTLGNQSLTTAEDTAVIGNLLVSANDVDSQVLTAAIVAGPLHGALTVNADGTFIYLANANYFGTDSFTYKVNDGALDSGLATVSLTITAVNDVPVAADATASTNEDTALTIDLRNLGVDVEDATLTPVIVSAPVNGQLTLNPDGSYTYAPDADFNGLDNIRFALRDSQGALSNEATLNISVTAVNDAPTLGNQTLTTAEDTALNGNLLAIAADVDSRVLTAAIVAGPKHGNVAVNADGTFSYRANANYFGTDSFTYKVNDGALDSGLATVSLTITAINDVPVATDATASTNEDTALTIDLRNLGVDVEDAALTPVIVSAPIHGLLTLNPDGSYTYAPAADFNGLDNICFALRDSEGALSNEATLNITVNAVNDAPTLGNQILTTAEDFELTGNLLVSADDVDSQVLTAAIVAGPLHGSVAVNADGTFSYLANANYFGTDSFTYKVNDGALDSGLATVSLTITAINDVPVATDATASTNEDTTLTIDLRDFGLDVEDAALSPVIVSAPTHGLLTLNPDGSYTYAPDADFNGLDNIRFALRDSQGALSNEATLNITVTAVNDAPRANAVSASLAEDGSVVLNLLAAATDVDGDVLTVAVTSAQSGTLLKNANGSYSYTPRANFNGADNFSYTVSDGQLSRIGLVQLTITAVNDVALAVNDSAQTKQAQAVRIDVLANDSDVDNATGPPVSTQPCPSPPTPA
ncbi:tandem-95 repeat protein [Polaromonas vacuolata]|uniref:tandem-95 repeat protein n=1 Tax=Polaromonas vacuolata TaxID=37448 RepID=UPI001456A07D|nr:Ig-like domain-containing protein [Polaromonas vacuolata]